MAETRTVSITTSDGLALHGELSVPDVAVAAAVLCHPHPQYGGNMHATLTAVAFDQLPDQGIAALRFDFRGVGASEGSYGGGVDERLDAAAAVDTLADAVPEVPTWLTGWSFGADVALATDHDRLAGWIGVAAPLAIVAPAEMVAPGDARPTLLLVPEHDSFRSPDSADAEARGWAHPATVATLPNADHFLGGRAADAVTHLADFILAAS